MKQLICLLILCILGFTFAMAAAKEETVYSKVGIYVEKGKHETTNYAAGVCYPANTKFTIKDIDGDEIDLMETKSGEAFKIINKEKFTKKDIPAIRESMFSKSPVDLSKHSANVKAAIEKCSVVAGMTKDEVILARGYPPAHKTPSLRADAWRYWRKRFDTGVVHFEKDKVVRIEERVDGN